MIPTVIATVTLGDPAPAVAQEDDSSDDSSSGTSQSFLGRAVSALGLLFGPLFLLLSFTLVALVVMNILTARRDNIAPIHLVEGFEDHLNEKRFQEAYEMAKNDESFLGLVLSAGLAKLSGGHSQAIVAMQEVGEEENMKLDHKLSYIALIGTIAPMIGLLGTVVGMIQAFTHIGAAGGGAPDASKLAADISTALWTTFVGLAIAIPAIAAFTILRNRVSRLVLEVGILSEGLMGRFQNVGKNK
jgi:biopolymer transport protein ExbB